jgi:energy-coupling factor transporter ATP-binding protein EcfA2
MADPSPPPLNPFPGLRPFQFHENHLFFGRDAQTDELLRRLRLNRFLAVIGSSGSGKSSLVRAGLLPDLYGGFMVKAGSSWRIAVCRPGDDPVHNLAVALSRVDVLGVPERDAAVQTGILEMTLRRSALGLVEAVRETRMTRTENLLVVVDQFEELFRFKPTSSAVNAENESAVFVKLLLNAARQNQLPIYIVITMRSDYLGDCAQFHDLPETINEGMYLIPRMTRDQRREAITGPVAVGGGQIAPRLVNRLLNDVTENPDQLPILQHALMRTWDFWVANHSNAEPIDLRHYEAIGGMTEALSRQADEAYDELPNERGRLIAEKMFKRLTEKGPDNRETRRPSSVRELCEVAGASESELCAVIDVFRCSGRSFLMPSWDTPLNAESIIDISHESLIRGWQRLRRWVDEEAASAETYRRLAETAELYKVGEAGLWRDPADLQPALKWRELTQPAKAWGDRYHPGFQEAIEFLEQSKAARDADVAERTKQRRIRFTLAWSTSAVLLVLLLGSLYTANRLSSEKKKAIEQKGIAQRETLRAETQNYEHMSNIQQMADRLVELSTPQEALFWHRVKAEALSQIGKHEDSIKEYDLVLREDPQNLNARSGRAYEYYTQREPEKALQDTKAYLSNVSISWSAHQTLGISLGLQGRYAEADKAIRDSIREFQVEGSEARERQVAPDIQAAIGHTILAAPEKAELTANYYELANLKAYAGSEEFNAALTEADKQPNSADAALFALNWASMQMEERKEDYGALIAQGALWERAGFKERAKKYYQDFERIHRERKDKRYDGLARWAARRLAKLKSVGPPLVEKASVVDTLVLQSQQLIAGNPTPRDPKLAEALARINNAIDIAGDDAMLYMYRALILMEQEHYSEGIADCDRILSKAPKTALAHFLRGIANAALKRDRKLAEADLRKALEYNPELAMRFLSDALYDRAEKEGFETSRPVLDEALQLLERSISAEQLQFKDLPYTYYKIARIHRARGDFREAKKSLETAIAIKDDAPAFYELWREAQKGLGKNEAQASCSLAGFHRQIAETKLHLGNSGKALDACWRGLEALTADEKQVNETEVKQEMAATMSEISQIIERAGSRAKATEFWQSMVELESMKLLRDGAKAEVKRLAKTR